MGRHLILAVVAVFVILTLLVSWSNALKCFSTIRGSSSSIFVFDDLKGLIKSTRHPDICISMKTEGTILDHKFGKTSFMGALRNEVGGLLPLVDDTCFVNNGTFEVITICGCSTDWCNNSTFRVDQTDYENDYEQTSFVFTNNNGQEDIQAAGFWLFIVIFTLSMEIIMQI